VSLAPAAGAQGELSGILMIKNYLEDRGETGRRKVLVPDSAHGTNPATAAMAGFEVVTVPSDADGNTDLDFLRAALDGTVAAMMLTLPSTLGLFDPNIGEIARLLHEHGALLYGDGANQNAFLGRARFGDLGFDVMHLNLHKTFSTPHGGGGPGAGPVCVKSHLAAYLPAPVVERAGEAYRFAIPPNTIGKTMAFHGNFGVLLRALTYIRSLGGDGLSAVSDNAVINANYVQSRLRGAYKLARERNCMHEVVLSGSRQKALGVKTLDIAKRLIDYGFHPPTIYFPLIVDESMMVEPTETEGKDALDAFCEAMLSIAREAQDDPDLVRGAPYTAPLRRLDEATAARKPVLRWRAG
jgi:glycine dehydrogenase subunit 2